MTTDLYNKIVSQRGSLENLVAKIPGFRGYQEKAARRKADSMLRRYLADQFEIQYNGFTQLENKILAGGKGLRYMSRTREVKMKIREYIDRIKTAAPKYSAMFASIKIGSEELEQIYAFDEAQLRYEIAFADAIASLGKKISSDEGIEEALDDIERIAQEANDAFKLRDNVITGLE